MVENKLEDKLTPGKSYSLKKVLIGAYLIINVANFSALTIGYTASDIVLKPTSEFKREVFNEQVADFANKSMLHQIVFPGEYMGIVFQNKVCYGIEKHFLPNDSR